MSYGLSGSVLTRAFGRVTSLQYMAVMCVSKKPGQTPPSPSGNLLRTTFSNCKTRGKMAAARVTQIHIFWRTNKNTAVVQLAIISGRIRVNYHTLAVIIPVV